MYFRIYCEHCDRHLYVKAQSSWEALLIVYEEHPHDYVDEAEEITEDQYDDED